MKIHGKSEGVMAALAYAAMVAFLMGAGPPTMATDQDRSPTQESGIARIAGRVTAGESGRSLPRAQLTLFGAETEIRTITDDNGEYELRVDPGRYWLVVAREGYSSKYYGQSGPEDPAKSIWVNSGDVQRVDLSLSRPGVLAGRVIDDRGEPVEGASVAAVAADLYMATTNDIGEFRIPRLESGDYIVSAHPPQLGGTNAATVYMPTYAPGTADPRQALPIRVTAAQTSTVDLPLIRGSSAHVEGTVITSTGGPAVNAEVTIALGHAGRFGGYRNEFVAPPTGTEGRFVIPGVPPGPYLITATAGEERGEQHVTLGEGLSAITITTRRGATAIGRLVIEDPAGKLCRNPVVLVGRIDAQNNEERQNRTVRVASDGRFTLDRLFGRVRIEVRCPQPIGVARVLLDGQRVDSESIESSRLSERSQLEITASTATGVVRGSVFDKGGRPCDCTILIVRDDPSLWRPPFDFLRSVRAYNGRFEVSGLPTGKYVALIEPLGRRRWDSQYLYLAGARGIRFESNDASLTKLDLQCE